MRRAGAGGREEDPLSPLSARSVPLLNVSDLLLEHQHDSLRALDHVVQSYNTLVQAHDTLRAEKTAADKAAERSHQENAQLWRSLKAMGQQPQNTTTSSTPSAGHSRRASVSRQNSDEAPAMTASSSSSTGDHQSSAHRSQHSNGGGNSSLAPSPHFARRHEPSDSMSSSSNAVRVRSATPPPLPASPRNSSLHAFRKGSSLDLARPSPNSDDYPQTPSQPVFPAHSRAFAAGTPDKHTLPAITPVSPFSPARSAETSVRSSPWTQPSSYATGSSSDEQLHPLYDPTKRSRTTSENSSLISPTASSMPRSPSYGQYHVIGSQPVHPLGEELRPVHEEGATQYDRNRNASIAGSFVIPHNDIPLHPDDHQTAAAPSSPFPTKSSAQFFPPAAAVSRTPSPRPVTLTSASLPFVRVRVPTSDFRTTEKGKEVVSFNIDVFFLPPPDSSSDPSSSAAEQSQGPRNTWRIEKTLADITALDAAVRSHTSRSERSALLPPPEKSLFRDHAPSRSDHRKAVLEQYLQTLLAVPMKDKEAICAFFNTDITSERSRVNPTSGEMEGWLTKKAKGFTGGWLTRYYVLSGGRLRYFESKDSSKMSGEIPLQNAAIGRQSTKANGDSGDVLHAFLIRTPNAKDDGETDHILCAENDEVRDAWVLALTSLQNAKYGTSRPTGNAAEQQQQPSRPAPTAHEPRKLVRGGGHERDREREIDQFADSDEADAKSPRKLNVPPPAASGDSLPPSMSMPTNLGNFAGGAAPTQRPRLDDKRSASELGQYSDLAGNNSAQGPSFMSSSQSQSRRPSAGTAVPAPVPADRATTSSPEKQLLHSAQGSQNKIDPRNVSAPMNAAPLPQGFDFKKNDRKQKTKSSFWNFGSKGAAAGPGGPSGAAGAGQSANGRASPHGGLARPVFGVPLKEAVAVSRIRPGLELPAVVYRCVEYLEAKNAEADEGLFRLSGSSNAIKALKDRFNTEGDVNLLQSVEYYDVHAIAGLLKTFLRELPGHILTRELQPDFLAVIDIPERADRVNALANLIARLPIEEYTLLRFFFAHLCIIAQNSDLNKMGIRNLGIVFSPTLVVPAPLFSMLLLEFDTVFAVDGTRVFPAAASAAVPPSASTSASMAGQGVPNEQDEDEYARAQHRSDEDSVPALSSSAATGNGTLRSPGKRAHGRRPNSELYEATGADKLLEYGDRSMLRELDERERTQ